MNSWKDITLGKAQKLMMIKEDAENPLDAVIEQIAILEDKTIDEVESMTPQQLTDKITSYKWTSTLPKEKFIPQIEHNGKKYAMTKLDAMTLAQFIDIEEYYKGGLVENIHRIVSILVLPVKEKTLFGKVITYDYEYDEDRAEECLEWPMDFVWQNALFFYHGASRYLLAIKDYSEEMVTRPTKTTLSSLMLFKKWEERAKQEIPWGRLRKPLGRTWRKNGAGYL